MNILDYFKGQYITVSTDIGIDVNIQIDHVEEIAQEYFDKYDHQQEYGLEYYTYKVVFINGKSKIYNKITDIKI